MGETIWVSTAPGHASNLRPLRHDMGEQDGDYLLTLTKKIKAGEPIGESDFPTRIWAMDDAKPGYDRLPHLFYAYGYWVVSAGAAQVLRQFDLGRSVLRPVIMLHKDRQTPIEGEWLCISIGNVKRAFVADESPKSMDGWAGGRQPPFVTKDHDIAVSSAALGPPDIWIDPLLHDSFFLSGPLGSALKKAKLSSGFFLSKCRLVENRGAVRGQL